MINTHGSRNKTEECNVYGQAKTGHDNLGSHCKVTKSQSLHEVGEIGPQEARKH